MNRDDLIFLGACILAAPGKCSLPGATEAAEALFAFSRTAEGTAPYTRRELLGQRDEKIREALAACDNNKAAAARMLGVKRTTLVQWIRPRYQRKAAA